MSFIFTFGVSHKNPATGESMGRNYVEIPGDIEESRQIMLHLFGQNWAFQYPDKSRARVSQFRLHKSLWPYSVDAYIIKDCGCTEFLIMRMETSKPEHFIAHRFQCPKNPGFDPMEVVK